MTYRMFPAPPVTDPATISDADDRVLREAFRDSTTGLPNRALLLERIDQALTTADQTGRVATVVIDIDRFRPVVNSLGHEAGDQVLVAIAARLRNMLRPGDTLARVADDEFAVVCRAPSDGEAVALAARLVEAITPPIVVDEEEIFLTGSAGVAFAGPGASPMSLMHDASAATQRAQGRARGSVEVFDPSRRKRLVERLKIESDLHRGLDNGELRVVYQPLVSLRDRTVVGVESLIRWAHPTLGLVAPARFLPVAEQTGLIKRIGEWVLREACQQGASWASSFRDARPPTMTVNVSTQQLTDPGFVGLVSEALSVARLAPQQLVLDITEGAFHDDPSVVEILHELKALGVALFLDDFVTGNAALSWLTRFPLDGVKLEATFVAGLGSDRKVRPLLEAVCGMADAFDLQVVAEGVETEEQASILEELGCYVAQGYLFSRPVPAGQLAPFLAGGLAPVAVAVAGSVPEVAAVGATVTMRQAAESLGVSVSTVRRWADGGRIGAARTKGGHRRLVLDDVRRLRAAVEPRPARVRRVQLPGRVLPNTAGFLREHVETVLNAGLKSTYEARCGGWFAEEGGRVHVAQWISALADACDSGDYDTAIEATATLTLRARIGATAMERVTFVDRSCSALLRLLSETDATRDELPAARRVCAALRHRALEDVS